MHIYVCVEHRVRRLRLVRHLPSPIQSYRAKPHARYTFSKFQVNTAIFNFEKYYKSDFWECDNTTPRTRVHPHSAAPAPSPGCWAPSYHQRHTPPYHRLRSLSLSLALSLLPSCSLALSLSCSFSRSLSLSLSLSFSPSLALALAFFHSSPASLGLSSCVSRALPCSLSRSPPLFSSLFPFLVFSPSSALFLSSSLAFSRSTL